MICDPCIFIARMYPHATGGYPSSRCHAQHTSHKPHASSECLPCCQGLRRPAHPARPARLVRLVRPVLSMAEGLDRPQVGRLRHHLAARPAAASTPASSYHGRDRLVEDLASCVKDAIVRLPVSSWRSRSVARGAPRSVTTTTLALRADRGRAWSRSRDSGKWQLEAWRACRRTGACRRGRGRRTREASSRWRDAAKAGRSCQASGEAGGKVCRRGPGCTRKGGRGEP